MRIGVNDSPALLSKRLVSDVRLKENIHKFLLGRVDRDKVPLVKGQPADKRIDGMKQLMDKNTKSIMVETYRDQAATNTALFTELFKGIRPVKRLLIDRLAVKKLLNLTVNGSKFGTFHKRLFERTDTRVLNDLGRAVSQGVTFGESIPSITSRVEPIVASFLPGTMERVAIVSEAIARDFVTEAYNQADLDFFKKQNFITGITVRETLDKRTCIICGARDGNSRKRPECFVNPWRLAHSRCRFFTEPEFEGKVNTQLRATRGVDGKTHRKEFRGGNEYQQWFATQPVGVQKTVLGPGRFDIFEREKLDFEDLVWSRGPRKGDIRTLPELKRFVQRKDG